MEYEEKTNKGEECKMERRVLRAPPDSDIIYTVNNSKTVNNFRLSVSMELKLHNVSASFNSGKVRKHYNFLNELSNKLYYKSASHKMEIYHPFLQCLKGLFNKKRNTMWFQSNILL